ncbi:MAG TPA: twin-arginine translocase TatA/TatE family subunit [Rickettsiales bacterium]|nr:twin-arginine translocase TatA/TatE family subunit [Rickettsiales bacterium]
MELSVMKLLLILVIVLLVFGAGKLPRVMNDIGKGIRSLKEGLKGEDEQDPKKISNNDKNNLG